MTEDLYSRLCWLRQAADFRSELRDLDQEDADFIPKLRRITSCRLDEIQLNHIAKRIIAGRCAGRDFAPLMELRIAIIGNATTDYLAPALIATGVRHGFVFDVTIAPYGQTVQEAVDPASATNLSRPDLVLCAIDHRGLPMAPAPGDKARADAMIDDALREIHAIADGFARNAGAVCMFQTLARPPETLFGSLDISIPGTWRDLIGKFNLHIAESIAPTPHLLLDTAAIAETVGLANWHDPALWNLAKAPFANAYIPLFADHVARIVAAWRGKTRRCLVLDLDNTLWGGIVGDDGPENIQIAEGDPVGEAHRDVQKAALRLRDRGVVLAICSKNDDAKAREPFRVRDEMLLREEHIAVFQANWSDKATNIAAIANELDLGRESLAFLDDNPAERGIVRDLLPEIAVIELGEDPAEFSRLLLASGFYELTAFSEEDRKRADDYQSNARRLALKESVGSVDEYLRSLDMEITLRPFEEYGRKRIAQLINKSNQFNLTTRRYSETDIAAMESDPTIFTMQVNLKDRFADNGMINVVICRRADDEWLIDTWLMSCRVLGRGVEQAVLAALHRHAARNGVQNLRGVFIPTARNDLVRDHYRKLGFSPAGDDAQSGTLWERRVDDLPAYDLLMKVNDLISAQHVAQTTANPARVQ